MNRLNSILAAGLVSLATVAGCGSKSNSNSAGNNRESGSSSGIIEGEVIDEARSFNNSAYPYAFTIRTKDNKKYTFQVGSSYATGMDSRIRAGYAARFNRFAVKGFSTSGNPEYFINLSNPSEIDALEVFDDLDEIQMERRPAVVPRQFRQDYERKEVEPKGREPPAVK